MSPPIDTVEEAPASRGRGEGGTAVPGVVIVFSCGIATSRALAVGDGLELGREESGLAGDERLSRRHVRIDRVAGQWRIRDLDSRNGTFVDGERIAKSTIEGDAPVVRIGQTILLLVPDVRAIERAPVRVSDSVVLGPAMQALEARIREAADSKDNLLVNGESGTGKEWAARTFHRRIGGPFVPVNCATIPHGLAERLLLGAQRGAYSGAVDNVGYVRAAEGGVLFLDEVGELEREVQAKLLRILESREVLPLGGTKAQPVDVRFCFATHRELRAAVAADEVRADLFYRIEQPSVDLPPLRERREEIPWLAALELERGPSPSASAAWVEACMLRRWPGNVRELLRHVRRAADLGRSEGATELSARHLHEHAGDAIVKPSSPPAEQALPKVADFTSDEVKAALEKHQGNVSAAARGLGVHRTQLRRLIEQFGLKG